MQDRTVGSIVILTLCLMTAGWGALPGRVNAANVTFSGTVTYQGTHTGDSLFVAILDTTGTEDVNLVALEAFAVGSPPFSQAYSLEFDNAGAAPTLYVASFLDVDGGGVDSVSSLDVLGWYAGTPSLTGISSSASQSGLDFDLPRAEIQGTVTFGTGQTEAEINASDDPTCARSGFSPDVDLLGSGTYAMIVYAGSYCVRAEGYGVTFFPPICFDADDCSSPTLVTVTATEVKTGIDFDFSPGTPTLKSTWGGLKARYR